VLGDLAAVNIAVLVGLWVWAFVGERLFDWHLLLPRPTGSFCSATMVNAGVGQQLLRSGAYSTVDT